MLDIKDLPTTSSRLLRIKALPRKTRRDIYRKYPNIPVAIKTGDYHKYWDLYKYDWQVVDLDAEWTTLLLVCARGTGKTALISHIVVDLIEKHGYRSVLLTNIKADLVKEVNIEGVDGVLAATNEDVDWKRSLNGGKLTWPNGAIVTVASASEKNPGRGGSYQVHVQDEYAWYDDHDRFHKSIDDSMRWGKGGPPLRTIIATTGNYRKPKVNQHLHSIKMRYESGDKSVEFRSVPISMNPMVSRRDIEEMRESFTGSELDWREDKLAEIILDAGDTLMIKRAMINKYTKLPDVLDSKICIVDPAVTSKDTSDYTAIGVLARKGNDYYVLHVRRGRWTPKQITENVIEVMARYRIEGLPRVEANQGGDFLKSEFSHVNMRIQKIYATRDKRERTNGVLGIFERRRIYFAPDIPEYAFDELTGFTGDPKTDLTPNDDIVDVIVHGLTQLSKGQIKKRKAIVVRS